MILNFEKGLAEKFGQENIGITFDFGKEEWFSCSCGHSSKVSDPCMFDENGKNYIHKLHKCPKCGTKFILEDLDAEMERQVLIIDYKTITDDENSFIIEPMARGIQTLHYTVSEFTNDSYNDFIYDKKEKCMYTNSYAFDKLIKNASYMDELDSCFDSDLTYDIPDFFLSEKSSVYKMALEFCKAAGIDNAWMNHSCHSNIKDFLYDLVMHINFRWLDNGLFLKHEYPSKLNRFLPSMETPIQSYFKFRNYGVDNTKQTMEEAWNIDIGSLMKIQDLSTYEKCIEYVREIYASGLNDIEMQHMKEIPYIKWDSVLSLANETKAELPDVIRHIHLGMENGYDAYNILKIDFQMLADGYPVDIQSAFSDKKVRRYEFFKNKSITCEEYDRFSRSPTLDTMFKIIENKKM